MRQPRTRQPKAKFKRVCTTCLSDLTVRIVDGRLTQQCEQCRG